MWGGDAGEYLVTAPTSLSPPHCYLHTMAEMAGGVVTQRTGEGAEEGEIHIASNL